MESHVTAIDIYIDIDGIGERNIYVAIYRCNMAANAIIFVWLVNFNGGRDDFFVSE